jgi:hypothetical protein
MENQPQPQPLKRTAVQRIDDLERGLMGMFQAGDNLARDVQTLKEAIKLLGNKVDAIVKATMAGEDLNDEVLSRIMVENNVTELKGKVAQLVASGTLVAFEGELNEKHFVIGQEVDDTGKVLNPRLQFVLNSLQPALREKILGKKVGDSVAFQDGKLMFEIQEAYEVTTPKAPTVEAAPAVQSDSIVAPDANTAAPDANTLPVEQSSTDASTDPAAQSSQSSGS